MDCELTVDSNELNTSKCVNLGEPAAPIASDHSSTPTATHSRDKSRPAVWPGAVPRAASGSRSASTSCLLTLSDDSLGNHRDAREGYPYSTRTTWLSENSLSGCLPSGPRPHDHQSLQPLASYLKTLDEHRARGGGATIGASVIDVAIQIPHEGLRLEAVRLLLSFGQWSFAFCGPCAVSAWVGDVAVLELLLADERIDINTGMPLVWAVRAGALPVLRRLLRDPRTLVNYGNPYLEAVKAASIEAMAILGAHTSTNVNNIRDNSGTQPLVYSMRRFLECANFDTIADGPRVGGSRPVAEAAGAYSSPTAHHSLRSAAYAVPVSLYPPCSEGLEGPNTRPQPRWLSCTLPRSAAHERSADRHRYRTCGAVLDAVLAHERIDVNSGYYASPLQMAVRAGSEDAIRRLLRHPRLQPNETPQPNKHLSMALTALHSRNAQTVGALSMRALMDSVAPPIVLAYKLRHLSVFKVLLTDKRVTVPSEVLDELERDPLDLGTVPYLEAIALYRVQWESWAWRCRRRCLVAAAVTSCVLTVVDMCLLCGCWSHVGVIIMVMNILGSATSIGVLAYRSYRHREQLLVALSTSQRVRRDSSSRMTPLSSSLAAAMTLTNLVVTRAPLRRLALWSVLVLPPLVPVADVWAAWQVQSITNSRREALLCCVSTNGMTVRSTAVSLSSALTTGGMTEPPRREGSNDGHGLPDAVREYPPTPSVGCSPTMPGVKPQDVTWELRVETNPQLSGTASKCDGEVSNAILRPRYCRPDLYRRSLIFASYPMLLPARLLVCVATFFVYLVVLFPDPSIDRKRCVGGRAFGAVATVTLLIQSGVLMLISLALRLPSPRSVLAGKSRQPRRGRDSCLVGQCP